MSQKRTIKFWLIFWSIAAIFLGSWFLYWNTKSKGISATAASVIKILPIAAEQKNDFLALTTMGEYFLKRDGSVKTLMVLFQNNLEIRPGGGFLGAFGIVKIKNGRIISLETEDLSNFDAKIPNNIQPPYPMKEIGYVDYWKMRDSNFSPDFAVDAQKAREFYALAGGTEKIDGVVGLTSNVLTSLLKITGPVEIDGYPGSYDSNNAIIALEYQVEKAFEQQGIDRVERKSIMSELAKEIERKISVITWRQKIQLAEILLQDLSQKDIQLQFENDAFQNLASNANWSGHVDEKWSKDFLMTSDANLGAFKSDYYVKRSLNYSVDLSGEKPVAKLKITYQHTANQKDWMTRNYLTYLRVYVPHGAEITNQANFDDVKIGEEFGKTYFGALVRVPIGETKTVEIDYVLPQAIKENYALKIQKQAGINAENISVNIIGNENEAKAYDFSLNSDKTIDW